MCWITQDNYFFMQQFRVDEQVPPYEVFQGAKWEGGPHHFSLTTGLIKPGWLICLGFSQWMAWDESTEKVHLFSQDLVCNVAYITVFTSYSRTQTYLTVGKARKYSLTMSLGKQEEQILVDSNKYFPPEPPSCCFKYLIKPHGNIEVRICLQSIRKITFESKEKLQVQFTKEKQLSMVTQVCPPSRREAEAKG